MNVSQLEPDDLVAARARIAGTILETPVMRSEIIDDQIGCQVFFKCEQLQITGSFKIRGASHAVSLLDESCPGVATHSSGNHGAALARAARARGLPAHVVMPENAVRPKVEAVRRFGGMVHFCEPTQAAREAGLQALVEDGFAPVPPYDDDRIIAGQGSCAMELLEQVPDLEVLIAPVGGGGLLAGSALAAARSKRTIQVIGGEPLGADDTSRSLESGQRVDSHQPDTIADGLRALVGLRNLGLMQRYGVEVITVEEEQILAAMRQAWLHLKQVIEPSGAVALAALHRAARSRPENWAGKRVGVILSGGNLDIEPLIDTLRPAGRAA
jgi:threonine dehydratase